MRPIVVLSLALALAVGLIVALVGFGRGPERAPGAVTPRDAAKPATETAADARPQAVDSAEVLPYQEPQRQAASAVREADTGGLAAAEGPTSWPNSLRGRVLDPEGKAIAGARVSAERRSVASSIGIMQQVLSPAEASSFARHATTGADGAFEFTSLEPALNWSITVKHERYSTGERAGIGVLEEGPTEADVHLKQGQVLQGYVVDAGSGAPIVGATLELMPTFLANLPTVPGASQEKREQQIERVHAAEDGSYQFTNVAPGTLTLMCRAKGYGTQSKPNLQFQIGEQPPLEKSFELTPALSISGKVVGPDYGAVGGATVQALYYANNQTSRGRAVTAADGSFKIDDLIEAPYLVIAEAPGFTQYRQNEVDAGSRDLTIELAEQGGVSGRVVSGEGDAPVPDFTLSLRQVDAQYGYGRAVRNETFRQSPDGTFALPGVEKGKYVIQAFAPGFAESYSAPFEVVQGLQTTDVVVQMTSGGTIVGKVVDPSGRPIEGARVTTFDNTYVESPLAEMFGALVPRNTTSRNARTGPDGTFRLELLTEQVYQLQIDHDAYTREILKDVRVSNGRETRLQTSTLSQGAMVRGIVYGEDGQPLRGATVRMNGAGTGELTPRTYQASTDTEGRYSIARVASGRYSISASSNATGNTDSPFKVIIEMKNSETSLTVLDGKEYTQDLRLAR